MVVEIILAAVFAPLLVAVIIAAGHTVRKVDRFLAAEESKWEKNTEEHNRSRDDIKDLRSDVRGLKNGQVRIESKIDTLQEMVKNGN